MADPPSSLHKGLPAYDPDVFRVMRNLHKHTDREIAVIGGSLIEPMLAAAIERKLIPLTKTETKELLYGTLGSFMSKVKLSYALGILDPQLRDDLVVISQIRNTFAHTTRPIDFATNIVSVACKTLNAESYVDELFGQRVYEASYIVDGASPKRQYYMTDENGNIGVGIDLLGDDTAQEKRLFVNAVLIACYLVVAKNGLVPGGPDHGKKDAL